MDQVLVLSMLMLVCYAYVAYGCLYLRIFATGLCTSICAYGLLRFAYATYACLWLSIYLLMGYDISEGIFCYKVWKKGKCLVGILCYIRRGGSMYIRGLILSLFCLSFFLLYAMSCIIFQYITSPIHIYLQPTELRSLQSSHP
jgi:hypothetical protein